MAATMTATTDMQAFVARFNAQAAAKARQGECTGSRNLPMDKTQTVIREDVTCHVCGRQVHVTCWGKLYVHKSA
jgi:hypothetical protein